MRAVTAAQMRAIDAAAVARDGEVELMRQAGSAIARVVSRYRQDGPIIALAGNGNNGGDAFAALSRLEGRRILYYDPTASWNAARTHAFQRARASGVELRRYPVHADDLRDAGLLIDGLLGVNARLPLDAATAARVRAMNDAQVPVLALDIATGCEPTTGALGDPHVRAVATVALGRPKLGSFLDPGRAATGDLWCAPIGMHDGDARDVDLGVIRTDRRRLRCAATQTSGRIREAQRGCAVDRRGLGTISRRCDPVRTRCRARRRRLRDRRCPGSGGRSAGEHISSSKSSSPTTRTIRKPRSQRSLDLSNHCNALAIGPGLGLSDAMGEIVRGVMAATSLPMVADASALFHLAKHLPGFAKKPLLLTPHASEFARLSGKGIESSRANGFRGCARSSPNTASPRCSKAARR